MPKPITLGNLVLAHQQALKTIGKDSIKGV
jgi:hypothetical protein